MQCQGTTADGSQCNRKAEKGRDYCYQHPTGNTDKSPTDAEIVAALERYRGGVYLAADHLGCTPKTIYNRAERSDEIAKTLQIEQGKVDDRAELGLIQAILNGEPWAIKFRLNQGSRDYAEHLDVDAGTSRAEIEEQLEEMSAEELSDLWRDVIQDVDGDGTD